MGVYTFVGVLFVAAMSFAIIGLTANYIYQQVKWNYYNSLRQEIKECIHGIEQTYDEESKMPSRLTTLFLWKLHDRQLFSVNREKARWPDEEDK